MISPSRSIEGIDYMDLEHILNRYRIREGWEVWQKYEHLFLLKGFSIIHYPCPSIPGYIEVAIINHRNFIQVVNKHLSDFQTLLGEKLSPQYILEQYIKGEGNIFNRIRNHDGLFGTILGFGRENAWEFMKRSGGQSLKSFLETEPKDTLHIFPPLFAVIPDSYETKELREKYERERPKIDLIYQKEDFLEIVLTKLMGYKEMEG
jgi:hypothetical protein